MRNSIKFPKTALLVVAVHCLGACEHASADPGLGSVRFELSVGLHSWPDVEDLQPRAGDKLHKVRFNVACAVHWPVKQHGDGDLLLGFDLGLFPNKSDIFAGGGYLLPSVKWRPSEDRTLSVDAGFGIYRVDIAEIAGDARLFSGTDSGKRNGLGGFFGGTWNNASARRAYNRGLMTSFEVHFVDLGTVNGQDLQPPLALEADAGKLDRGFYQLHSGYRWE